MPIFQISGTEKLHEAIDKLRDEMVNPEKGLYPRVMLLEKARDITNKFYWILVTCGATAIATLMIKYLVTL